MRLKAVSIQNFRRYKDHVVVPIEGLTAFIGKNDAGKSTILEALDIFFEGGVVNIEGSDANVSGESANVVLELYSATCPPFSILTQVPKLAFKLSIY